VRKKEQWTIGIYRGSSPFSLNSSLNLINPILKAEDVTDVPAKFVADPFLIKEGEIFYLFFEVFNHDTQQGDLALATSTNSWSWDYQQVIVDEPFHLSYPYVFKWQDEYYLIPESYQDNSIRLYRADHFPLNWSFVATIIEGRDYVDNSIVYYQDRWWLFASVTQNDTLYLFHADQLTGPWAEHPSSPIVKDNIHKGRPGGRVFEYNGSLYRYGTDNNSSYGYQHVMAYEITELTLDRYNETLAHSEPIVKPSGSGWNALSMHHVDPVQIKPNQWIASVDGFGTYLIFGLDY